MAYNEENILVGAADIYVGDDAATVPTATDASLRDTEWTDWRHVGLTQGGVEFSYSPDYGEVEVDQWLDVAKMYKQRQSVTVNTTLVEATLENLLFAWGQSEDTLNAGTLTISAGALGDKPQERQVAFVGNAPGGANDFTERVFHLNRALSVEASTFSLSRAEATTIPVSLRCLPASAAGGDYGTIVDRTWTPAE